MKSRVFVGIIVVCLIAGCKSRESSNSSETGVGETQTGIPQTERLAAEQSGDIQPETGVGEKQTEPAQNEDLVTVQPEDIQPDQQAPKCPNGSVFKENKCVCNDGSVHLGEGWYCLTEGQRCYPEAGCHYGEKIYPQYTTFLKGQFLCGDIIAPETAFEYKCEYHVYATCFSDPYSIGSDKGQFHYHWRCTQEKCHCGNELVSKDHFCTVEKKSPDAVEIKSDNTAQEVKNTALEAKDTTLETKDTALEIKDAALETKDTALENEDAEPEGEDTDPEDEDTELDDDDSEPDDEDTDELIKRYYGYVCENNTWVYKDTSPWNDYENLYCDGIPLSAIGNKDDFFIGDHVYVNRILEGSEIPIYHCRYGQWVCQKTTGCPCFDGEKTRQISFGESCENDKANCKNAKSPVSKDESFQKLNNYWYRLIGVDLPGDEILNELEEIDRDGVCLEDSCPCGKYTNRCMCGNLDADLYKEFYCSIFPVAEDLGETLKRYKAGGLLICLKEEGCHTGDGRHYPKWATIGFGGFEDNHYQLEHPYRTYDEGLFYNEALMYHIDAGFDTTTESMSVLGECVLDRNDDLVRYSQADGVDSYVCDQAVCPCGDARCRPGEICDHGKCRADACKVHNKTKCLYNTNLVSGILTSVEPEDSEECGLNETDDSRMYYDVIECKGGHRYCHGKNNPPIRAPENPDGYLCQDVTDLPNIDAKDNLKAWICNKPKGCACGESECKSFEACIDGVCLNVPKPVEYCNGVPMVEGYRCEHVRICSSLREIGQVCAYKTCVCGDTECPMGAFCSDGHCLQPSSKDTNHYEPPSYYPIIRSDNYNGIQCINEDGCRCNGEEIDEDEECLVPCFGDGRLDEEGCWCGQTKLKDPEREKCYKKDEQYYVLCNNEFGCECGDTGLCPMSTYCSQNQCIDPLTGQAIKSGSDRLEPVTACPKDSCPCGQNTCAEGQFCIGGMCKSVIFARITGDGRTYYYDYIPSPGKPPTQDLEGAFWNNIESGMLVDADEKSYEYSLSVNTVEEWCCCDEHDYYIGRSKKRCSLASGCSCGNEKCRYAEVCEDSKCTDDDITELCGSYYAYNMMYEGFQYKDSNCYCKGTVHSITSLDYNFVCTPFGWFCDEEEYVSECDCGDEVCSIGEYCVMPGVCANPKRP